MNSPENRIVTRFAPSPTGFLHIGGARTALFNWLYARGRGGRFLLRIEDTDRARHNEAAVDAILDGLSWLGIDWDGSPVSQYENRARHRAVALELLDRGHAYKCYMSAEEIDAARNKAREEKTRFESPWRDADPATAPAGVPYTIRFRAPQTGETIVSDRIQGAVKFPNSAFDDLILIRSAENGDTEDAGAPTYNLAVVVDDHDMGVTHIVRGDDHLTNAARQQQIYEALGWPVPHFAHVPLIHGPDGAKLSKRHGALGVEAYRDMGVTADALANYLLRLGWSHGDDEFIPRAKALEWFDLDHVNKSPARLDLDKLTHLNRLYLDDMPADALLTAALPFLKTPCDAETTDRLRRAAPFLKERMSVLTDINDVSAYLLLMRPLTIEGKAGKPLEKEGARDLLTTLHQVLDAAPDWSGAEPLDAVLQKFADDNDIGFGKIGPPLRAALTAGKPSPGIGAVLFSLGKDESLARISDEMSKP